MMRKYELTNIQYSKDISESSAVDIFETTDRSIIPTQLPSGNIKAMDVTDLTVEEREQMAEYHLEYARYFSNHVKQAFSFEDWLSHSKGVDFAPKWRTFKPEQTEILS